MKTNPDTHHPPKEHAPNLRERFDAAQERITDMYAGANKKAVSIAKRGDATIRDNPYPSLAIAFGAGLLAGVLVARCRE